MHTPDETALLPSLPSPPRTVFVRGPLAGISGQPGPDNGTAGTTPDPSPPGSKYYTLRYLLNALLANGESVVRHPALSDDTAVLVGALRSLGATVAWGLDADHGDGSRAAEAWMLRVRGVAGHLASPPDGVLHVGNAGAVLRLLLGIGATLPAVRFETDHPDSLGRRPNADLLDALRSLGATVEAREPGGLLPITLRGGALHGGSVSVAGARSSQYLSALLYLGTLLPAGLDITVTDTLRSAPLIRATLRALAAAGVRVHAAPDLSRFTVPGGQRFTPRTYDVPGDGPTAAALASAALLLGVPLRLERLSPDENDVAALLAALRALGADLSPTGDRDYLLMPGARLHGARIDGDACIDSIPALAALACFADGETVFENVATLRLKESDRIADLCAELALAGCDVTPGPDSITVRGGPAGIPGGVTLRAHDDHRLAQALAIAALRSDRGLTIAGAGAVAKSYPTFFADLACLGATVNVLDT